MTFFRGGIITHGKGAVIGPHPDDIDLGCAVSLHDYYLKGYDITTIVLTEGERGGDGADRVLEQSQSLKALAPTAKNYFLNFADTQLFFYKNQIINKIRSIVCNNMPSIIYIPSNHDFHQDHVVAHECAMNVFNFHRVCKLICYETPSTTSNFSPNFFKLCTEEQFQVKIQALKYHKSQGFKDYFSEEAIYTIAKMRAVQGRYHNGLAEAFEIIRATEI